VSAASALLAEIRAVGADASVEDGALCIWADEGVLTDAHYQRLTAHRIEIAALLAEPANDRYGPDEIVADLKAVFADDGPASDAAAERLAKIRMADSPAGDDLPAWRGWMRPRYEHWRRRGYSRAEAWRIVWGEAEWEWHKRHGAVPDPDHCAGCGQRLAVGSGMELLDGAVVHGGDCRVVYDAQWRGAASVGLMALGLTRPWR
jgi:hypothetical protein